MSKIKSTHKEKLLLKTKELLLFVDCKTNV